MKLFRHTNCRVCGLPTLTPVVSLGKQYLQNAFIFPNQPKPYSRKIPLSLVLCDRTQNSKACGLLQMEHTVPPRILYSSYWYRSRVNQTMRDHLKEIVDSTLKLINKKKGRFLDIGCNDGTLLSFVPSTWKKVGVDPSDATDEISTSLILHKSMFPHPHIISQYQIKPFDIITSIAMFYDVEDPVTFVKAIKSILSKNGVWIFEVAYLPTMLKNNSFDTICTEHLSYFRLAVLLSILERAGMKCIDVALNNLNGGSIRLWCTHKENTSIHISGSSKRIENLLEDELKQKLDLPLPYIQFQKRIEKVRSKLIQTLRKLKKERKTIHLYGASTKGNTIIQFCGITKKLVEFIADRNPLKHGAMTLGTNIPIISEEASRRMKPDYYLVMPWSFRTEFLKRETETMKKGVRFIFPLPQLEIIPKP